MVVFVKKQIKKTILVLLTSLMVVAPMSSFGVNTNQVIVTYAAKSTKKSSIKKKSSSKKSTAQSNNYNNRNNVTNSIKTPNTNTNNVSDRKVWIPNTGKKYHSNKSCSKMKDPTEVTLSEAKARGYKACKKCFK